MSEINVFVGGGLLISIEELYIKNVPTSLYYYLISNLYNNIPAYWRFFFKKTSLWKYEWKTKEIIILFHKLYLIQTNRQIIINWERTYLIAQTTLTAWWAFTWKAITWVLLQKTKLFFLTKKYLTPMKQN